MIHGWDHAAFADAKCGSMATAAAGVDDDDNEAVRLRRMCEQAEALGGRIAQMFGTDSPEARVAQALWIMLRHDLSILEKQAAG